VPTCQGGCRTSKLLAGDLVCFCIPCAGVQACKLGAGSDVAATACRWLLLLCWATCPSCCSRHTIATTAAAAAANVPNSTDSGCEEGREGQW
jgi:hypothetical protein